MSCLFTLPGYLMLLSVTLLNLVITPVATFLRTVPVTSKMLKSGAAVNWKYREQFCSEQDCLISVPGCPKSIDGNPWVYFGKPKRCFLTGVYGLGPCPPDHVLFPRRHETCGRCVPVFGVDGFQTFPEEREKSATSNVRRVECPAGFQFSKRLQICVMRVNKNSVGIG